MTNSRFEKGNVEDDPGHQVIPDNEESIKDYWGHIHKMEEPTWKASFQRWTICVSIKIKTLLRWIDTILYAKIHNSSIHKNILITCGEGG